METATYQYLCCNYYDYIAVAPGIPASRHPGIPASRDIRASLHIAQATSKKEQRHLKEHALRGNDIVDSAVRLCAMNLYLHGIGGDECPVTANDALAKEVGDDRVDMVLANPPFGKKSSITVINEKTGKKEQEKLVYERKVTAWTKKFWVYDYRTNVHKTLKQNRLALDDFSEFIQCYKAEDRSKRRESKKIERWQSFTYDELIARDKTNLDIFWLKDESLEDTENLPPPDVLAAEIVEQLEAALEEFRSVEEVLAGTGD